MDDLISRQSIKKKLQEHHDFLVESNKGWIAPSVITNARIDEISNCIAKITNEPSVQPEPFLNKPCISEGVCHENKMKVLEKIKAEMQDIMIVSQDEERIYQEIKAIIDKYMAESEDNE